MLLEIERDKAITDKVILIQKVVRGFKDRWVVSVSHRLRFYFILFYAAASDSYPGVEFKHHALGP